MGECCLSSQEEVFWDDSEERDLLEKLFFIKSLLFTLSLLSTLIGVSCRFNFPLRL